MRPHLLRAVLSALCLIGLVLLAATSHAADASKRTFDIPAGDAASAIKQFSTQSGEQLLYKAESIEGVTTHGIKGEHTPLDALNFMFEGTGLVATQDPENGALSLVRAAPVVAPPERSGATRTIAHDPPQANEEIVALTPFQVVSTQDRGYVYGNAVSGLKTNQAMMDIPQVDTVITRDFLDDVGFTDSSSIIQYFGAGFTFTLTENPFLRGGRIWPFYVDEMPQNASFEDNVWVDSYEIVKGPAQILYLNGALSGALLKTTKQPMPYHRDIVTVSITSWGTYRATVDSTGPLCTLGDTQIAYRLVGAYQSGSYYFVNFKNDSAVIFPEISAKWKNTSARVYYTYEKELRPVGPTQGMLTPSGNLFTAIPWKVQTMLTPGTNMKYETQRYYTDIVSVVGQNCANRFKFGANRVQRYIAQGGSETIPMVTDWNKGTETWDAKQDNYRETHFTVLEDFQAHYDVGFTKNIDIIGGGFDEFILEQRQWTARAFGWANGTGQVVNFYDPNAMNFATPSWKDYDIHIGSYPNQGSHAQTQVVNIYEQHTIDITKYLSLTAGWAWSAITAFSTPNISTLPWQTTSIPVQHYLHRYGMVLKPTKEISIYAMHATTFAQNTQGNQVTYNGLLPPPQVGEGQEVGLKTAFFGGRLSTDFAWFHMALTNNYIIGPGYNPAGLQYIVPIGDSVQEGVDGDVAFSVVPGWQLIGSFFSGHNRDYMNRPIGGSYDNSWAMMNRYAFSKESALHGLEVGAGVVRYGGRWMSTVNYIDAPFTAYTMWSGMLKMETGTPVNLFASYLFNKHFMVKLTCNNALNQDFAEGGVQADYISVAMPRTFLLELNYKL